ncbi:MAG: phospholipase D-like domain-containing protein [Thermofilum sp.]
MSTKRDRSETLKRALTDTIDLLTTMKKYLIIVEGINQEFQALISKYNEFKRYFLDLKSTSKDLEVISHIIQRKDIKNVLVELLSVLEETDKSIRSFIDNFSIKSNLIETIQLQSSDFIKNLDQINLEEAFGNIHKLNEILRKIRDSISLSSRRSESNERQSINNILNILRELRNTLEFLSDCLSNLREGSLSFLESQGGAAEGSKSISRRAISLASFIEGSTDIWVHDLISAITGLRSVTGELETQEVTLRIAGKRKTEESESLKIPIDDLLIRYPPFEPVHEEADGVIGSNVWFIDSKNVSLYFYPGKFPRDMIIKGLGKSLSHGLKLLEVETVNLMKGNVQEIILGVHLRERASYVRNLWVKYGSRKLYERLRDELSHRERTIKEHVQREASIKQVIENLQKEYAFLINKEERKAYRVNDLGYVWYCIRGYAMSTDPYDLDCPFKDKCRIGQHMERRRCGNWSRSRKLFPKVYVESERRLLGELEYPAKVGLFNLAVGRGVLTIEYFTGAQWFMPTFAASFGNLTRVEFKQPIVKELPSTNAVGFSLPLSLVRALLSELMDEQVTPKPEVKLAVGEEELAVTLDRLLLSKYLFYKLTGKGYHQLEFLQLSMSKIEEEASKFFKKLKLNESEIEDLLSFLVSVLGHTLSHLFHSFISSSLELEPRNLSYTYIVDSEKLTVLVFENSPFGVIDLPGHVLAHFGSYEQMIEQFLSFAERSLDQHEKEIIQYKKHSLEDIKRKATSSTAPNDSNPLMTVKGRLNIAEKLEKSWYIPLVNHNVIMDIPTFIHYLFLSNSDIVEKIAKEFKVDSDELQRWLDSLVRDYTGIVHCIDGCTACVVLDQGCFNALTQNLTLSRNLVKWILKVLLGRETVYGRGSKLIDPLLSVARKEVIILSPYVDEEGVKILEKVAGRGVKVIVLTREEYIRNYGSMLRERGVVLYPVRDRHDKMIIIDNDIIVETTQNLSSFSSINSFKIARDPERAKNLKAQLLKASEALPQGISTL